MTLPIFDRLAVVGMGLVGGSVALGAAEKGIAREVRGVDPALSASGGTAAGGIPLVPLPEAASWADAVVLAMPVGALDEVLATLAVHLDPSAAVTDVLSVKGPVASAVRRLLPHPERCVGAHPMAGGDAGGFAHARADLFEGAACILAVEGHEPAGVVDQIDQFWQCFGTVTVRHTPAEHDEMAAWLSHAPHAIAYAYAQGLTGKALDLAGAGLRDFVRIARANPALWCEILLLNRSSVAEEIGRFEQNLGTLRDALARGDRKALEEVLRSGQKALDKLER